LVARYRLSGPAQQDIAAILRISETRHGASARSRYRGLLAAALRRIADDPLGTSTLDRGDVHAGLRSFHIHHCREARGARPAHVIFYRTRVPGVIEIVRVLHDRMDPGRHLDRESA
jgi:toxin ParE1/3/4